MGYKVEGPVGNIQQSHYCICGFSFLFTRFLNFCFQLPHVFVNCVECFTSRLLLEQILNKLNHLCSSEDGCSTQVTCETFNDFVRLFKQVTKAESLKDQTVYIVSNIISLPPIRKLPIRSISVYLFQVLLYYTVQGAFGIQKCFRYISYPKGTSV